MVSMCLSPQSVLEKRNRKTLGLERLSWQRLQGSKEAARSLRQGSQEMTWDCVRVTVGPDLRGTGWQVKLNFGQEQAAITEERSPIPSKQILGASASSPVEERVITHSTLREGPSPLFLRSLQHQTEKAELQGVSSPPYSWVKVTLPQRTHSRLTDVREAGSSCYPSGGYEDFNLFSKFNDKSPSFHHTSSLYQSL